MQILRTLSSKVLRTVFKCKSSSRCYILCRFGRLHLPKVIRTPHFFNFELQIELWLQSSTLFVDNFPRSRRETDRNRGSTSATPGATLSDKHTGFRTRECLNSHVSKFLHFPIAWWWVVDMMWLKWSWNWECCPWPSSVTRKFSN